jgi:hypothetical protein
MEKLLLVSKKIALGLLVVLAVIVLIIALFAYYERVQPAKTPDFKISISSTYDELTQGSSIQIPIQISDNKNSNQPVNLTAISNSTNLQFTLQPNSGFGDFSTALLLSPSNSTPTNYFQINVVASDGNETQTVSCIIAVLSAKITLTGHVAYAPELNSPYELDPIKLTFADSSTGTTYTSSLNDSGTYSGAYSINLENQHTYNVTYYYLFGIGTNPENSPPGLCEVSYDFGWFIAYSPAGNSTQNHDFIEILHG